MIGFDALLKEIGALDAAELTLWIDSGWVRPEGEPGNWLFHEVDVARVRLIVQIRHDLAIDVEAVPVVLSLLDQLYGLRRELGALCGAIAAQPAATRQAIAAALRARGDGAS
ncbi:MAG TPA: chaperone modulator CbpM [Stellaceae bacterium]|nr:chaperone modulator CbpM [Stellaceae bacterium]